MECYFWKFLWNGLNFRLPRPLPRLRRAVLSENAELGRRRGQRAGGAVWISDFGIP